MVIRKAIVLGAIMAMSSTPALAAPGNGNGNGNGGPKEPKPDVPVKKGNPHNAGQTPAQPAPRCVPHTVGYVVSGTLVSDTLVEAADHTYSGEVTVAVQHGNSHSRTAVGTTATYKLEGAHLVLAVADANGDGVINSADLAAGDRVHVLGRISAQPKSCTATEAPQPVISAIAFHAPRHHGSAKASARS